MEGEPAPLPPGVDLSAYRIVQEALTNALKHAGGPRARVRRRATATDGSSSRSSTTARGAGERRRHAATASSGIRERVAVVGGELDAGPAAEGGYAVRARLPLGAAR